MSIVSGAGAGGTVFTLAAGVYVIDYELSLMNGNSAVALYTGPNVASLLVDNTTVSGSSPAGAWIHARSIHAFGATTVVAVSPVIGNETIREVDNTNLYIIRLTFLKLA